MKKFFKVLVVALFLSAAGVSTTKAIDPAIITCSAGGSGGKCFHIQTDVDDYGHVSIYCRWTGFQDDKCSSFWAGLANFLYNG